MSEFGPHALYDFVSQLAHKCRKDPDFYETKVDMFIGLLDFIKENHHRYPPVKLTLDTESYHSLVDLCSWVQIDNHIEYPKEVKDAATRILDVIRSQLPKEDEA